MHPDYSKWLKEQRYAEGTQTAQLYRVKKVEECYGNLDEHLANGTYQDIINDLTYSTHDERTNKSNPSKIKFEGNIRKNLASYKGAAVRYQKFLSNNGFQRSFSETAVIAKNDNPTEDIEESIKQRFALERDMQAALRRDITSLEPDLNIIDDGAERAVDSGLIDIVCEDKESLVVIELKAGKADSRAIGQILGYMGDLQEEEDGKPVRGILVAHDFDKRAKAAARVVPMLMLKKYSIEFKFATEE